MNHSSQSFTCRRGAAPAGGLGHRRPEGPTRRGGAAAESSAAAGQEGGGSGALALGHPRLELGGAVGAEGLVRAPAVADRVHDGDDRPWRAPAGRTDNAVSLLLFPACGAQNIIVHLRIMNITRSRAASPNSSIRSFRLLKMIISPSRMHFV